MLPRLTSTGGRRGPCSGCQTHTQQSADIASLTSRSTRLWSHATHLQTRRGSTLKSLTPEDRILQAPPLASKQILQLHKLFQLVRSTVPHGTPTSVHFLRHHDPSVPSRPYEHSVIQCNRVTNRVLVHPNMSTSHSCMLQRMREAEKNAFNNKWMPSVQLSETMQQKLPTKAGNKRRRSKTKTHRKSGARDPHVNETATLSLWSCCARVSTTLQIFTPE